MSVIILTFFFNYFSSFVILAFLLKVRQSFGNSVFGFCRYCGKVFPEPAAFNFFEPRTHKCCFCNIFLILILLNKVRANGCPPFCYVSLVLKQLIFYIFHKVEFFWIKRIRLKIKNYNNYKKRRHPFVQQCFWKLCTKFQGKRASNSGTGTRGIWQLMILTLFFNLARRTCSVFGVKFLLLNIRYHF